MQISNEQSKYLIELASESVNHLSALNRSERRLMEALVNSVVEPNLVVTASAKQLVRLQDKLLTAKEAKLSKSNMLLLGRIRSIAETIAAPSASQALASTLMTMPAQQEDVPSLATLAHEAAVQALANQIETIPEEEIIDANGTNHYGEVLTKLDELKDRLGGAPRYHNERPPAIDTEDRGRRLFGVPVSAVKDWLRMTVDRSWFPRPFWNMAARVFGATEMTPYEKAAQAIQRFGIVQSNKEFFVDMLKERRADDYGQFMDMTGLAWHPNDNGWGVEKGYMDFMNLFLTEYYEQAKAQADKDGNDDALVEYFEAFKGICFEGRMRALEEYAEAHPLASMQEFLAATENVADYTSESNMIVALNSELQKLTAQLGDLPTPADIMEHLQSEELLGATFADGILGTKVVQDYILKAQYSDFMADCYELADFLASELALFRQAQPQANAGAFKTYLTERMQEHDDSIEVKYPDSDDEEAFDVDHEAVADFITANFQ